MTDKAECQICHKEFPLSELFPTELIRNSVLESIKKKNPDWNDDGFICSKDLRTFRTEYIERNFLQEKGELTKLDREVFESLEQQKILTENINEQFDQKLTFGQHIADKVARWGGSWAFILTFLSIIVIWMGVNIILFDSPFDPYPFILLNLFLSCLAAIQAPIIMMSQNRQAARDRCHQLDSICCLT